MKIKEISFKNSISFHLVLWFLLLTLTPLGISNYIYYKDSAQRLEEVAMHDIEQSSIIGKKFVQNWFYYRNADISNWSKQYTNIYFLDELKQGFLNSKIPAKEYVKSKDYQKLIKKHDHDLSTLMKEYDYIYDLFLIDTDGNILYTVAKESDLATSLNDGAYSGTKFAKAFKNTLKDKKIHFSDLEIYKASNETVTGFLTAPLYSNNNTLVGVMAVQIRLDRIFSLFDESIIDELAFNHYLVGEDGLLRSSTMSGEEVLKFKVKSKQFDVWKKHASSDEMVNYEEVIKYKDPFGNTVLGIHQDIDILGVKWALFSEMNENNILDSIHKIRDEIFIFFLFIAIIVIFASIYIARRLTKPIMQLYNANIAFANGDKNVHVETDKKGELGLLAKAFNKMIDSLNLKEKKLQQQTDEARKALQELDEQKFALDAHAIVAITDVKGDITFVNDKFIEISGYQRDELIGKNHRLINSGAHSTQMWADMYKTISSGKIWHKDICNVAKDGRYYWVSTTIVPFMDEKNKPRSYIAIRTDITAEKNAEFKLIEANELAQESVRLKSEFLASMSHEIRTPMNGVIGMLDLLLKTELDETQKHQAELAQSSATALLTLINDILDFSKVDAGKMELEYIDFDLRDELGKFAEAMAFKAQEKGVELLLDLTEVEKTLVNGDPGRIRQILSNIVGNSVKFTNEGYILIKAKLNTIDSTKARLILEMRDTGIGIPEDKIDILFDLFSQVDASTTRKYGGTGLGLAIVKKLCVLMDGDVKVTSKLGYGSTFVVDIALKIPKKSSLVMPYSSVDGKKILIVDTSEHSIDVLQTQLEHWGMEVSSTCSAKEAFEMIEKEYFDIVFLDMFISDCNSCEFAKEIRKNKDKDDMRLVIMTSLADRGNALKYAEIGIDAYFPKPATTHDLFIALDTLSKERSNRYKQNIEKKAQLEFTWKREIEILLVEDNITNQLVAQGVLESFNLKADIANNGMEALEILNKSKKRYDVILMDCQMPIMDGYETSEAIRMAKAGSQYVEVPIIAMTANAMSGDKEKCFISGMSDYISKPIDPQKLKDALFRYLEADAIIEKKVSAKKTKTKSFKVFDSDDALSRLGGSQKMLSKIISVFLEDIDKQIESIKDAINEKDRDKLKSHAHTIKGSAANLSAYKLNSTAKDMEFGSQDKEFDELKIIFKELKESSDELKAEFLEYLKALDIDLSKKTIPKDRLLELLKSLHVELENDSFIDSNDLELFESSFNEDIDTMLHELKNNVDNFMRDNALKLIDDIVARLGDTNG
jgi:PAS domain S-box-containing protein